MPLEEFYEGPESNWRYVFRCKMCPDGIGLSADITGADYWEDCMPEGEDPGFNTIVARTAAGADLLQAAIDAGYITITEDIDPDRMSATQPHHVRKRIAMKARMAGLEDVIGTRPDLGAGLRLDELSDDPESETYRSNRQGTAERVRDALS
jgi:coenzyme F420 hydrogenase subunit beta